MSFWSIDKIDIKNANLNEDAYLIGLGLAGLARLNFVVSLGYRV